MKAEVKVPPMGESITEATVSNIIKKSGSQVNLDDEIIELETDKVNQVLYAPKEGLLTLDVNIGDKVTIGQVLGSVDTESKSSEEEKVIKSQEETSEKNMKDDKAKDEKEMIYENKTDIKPRISKEDFAKSLELKSTEKEPDTQSLKQVKETPLKAISSRNETRRPMSNIRKMIASRMVEVKNTTAILTTFNEVDMSAVIALRDKFKDQFTEKNGVKLGFMSFFVKACVSALKAFPDINSYIDRDEIVHRDYYDIGVAVGTDRGVIVPVVRDCDHLNYAEIELAIEQFSKKARGGTISVDDLKGGGFTITNGGVYGSMLSTPIISPNQSAILGLHKISKRAIVVNDEIVIRPIMYLALSYDHRIVDGKEAVSFLVHIKDFLEFPGASLLGL